MTSQRAGNAKDWYIRTTRYFRVFGILMRSLGARGPVRQYGVEMFRFSRGGRALSIMHLTHVAGVG